MACGYSDVLIKCSAGGTGVNGRTCTIDRGGILQADSGASCAEAAPTKEAKKKRAKIIFAKDAFIRLLMNSFSQTTQIEIRENIINGIDKSLFNF